MIGALASLVIASTVPVFGAPLFPNQELAAGIQPSSIARGDFNGDGRQDLAVTNSVSFDVSVFLGQGDGTFGSEARVATGYYPLSVAVGDFNGDRHQDLAVANLGFPGASVGDVSILLEKFDMYIQRARDLAAKMKGNASFYRERIAREIERLIEEFKAKNPSGGGGETPKPTCGPNAKCVASPKDLVNTNHGFAN